METKGKLNEKELLDLCQSVKDFLKELKPNINEIETLLESLPDGQMNIPKLIIANQIAQTKLMMSILKVQNYLIELIIDISNLMS